MQLMTLLLLFLNPLQALGLFMLFANHKGSEGAVVVGTSTVGELRGWDFAVQNNPIDDSTLNDAWTTHKSGQNNWNGSATCWWDETDTNGQQALAVGSSVGLVFYPEGTGTSRTRFTGTALVTGINYTGAIDGIVERNFSFTGDGILTESTV